MSRIEILNHEFRVVETSNRSHYPNQMTPIENAHFSPQLTNFFEDDRKTTRTSRQSIQHSASWNQPLDRRNDPLMNIALIHKWNAFFSRVQFDLKV